MPTPAQLITWFDRHLNSLPVIGTTSDKHETGESRGSGNLSTSHDNTPLVALFAFIDHSQKEVEQSIESAINMLFEDLPIGINEYNVPYRSIPFKKSGPSGWTWFPADDSGVRIARLSCVSPVPDVYVRILAKLHPDEPDTRPASDADTDVYTYNVAERAVLIIDNLTGHGRVNMRRDNPVNKRRKLCIKH